MDSKIGFVIPVIGIPHQKYLYHRYQIFNLSNKVLIGFWIDDNGWSDEIENYILISKKNLIWRIFNKIHYNYQALFYRITKQFFIPILPLGWQKQLKHVIKKNRITGLIINYGGLGVALLPLLKELKIPFIVTFEGSDAQVSDISRLASKKLRELWKISEKNIFVSKFLEQQALTRGCPASNCTVVYNAINIIHNYNYLKPQKPIKLVCVANLYPVKGHIYLLKAIKQVIKYIPDIILYLIGDGELLDELNNFTIDNKLTDNVIFLGRIKWESVQKKLSECNIYIQTSVKADDGQEEGLSFSTIEAQSLGLPAIVYNSGGLKEIVENNVTGFIIPERSIDELADAIIHLSSNEKLHKEMSHAANVRMKKLFNMENQAKIWNSLFNELFLMDYKK